MAAVSFSDLIHPVDSIYLHKESSAPSHFNGSSNEGPAACFGGTWVDLGLTKIDSITYRVWYRQG